MESNSTQQLDSDDVTKDARTQVVKQLQKDRQQVAERAVLPLWFHPALGAVAVTYVITPALPSSGVQNSGFMFAFVATLVLINLAQRSTGIKVGKGGLRGRLIVASMLAVTLVGLIVTLGLVSFELNWWAVIPALSVFTGVLILSRFYEKVLRNIIINGR